MRADLTIGKHLGKQFDHNQGLGALVTATFAKLGVLTFSCATCES